MATYTFYEPFYFGVERLLNDPLVSNQGGKSGCSGIRCAAVERCLQPRSYSYQLFIYASFILTASVYRLDVHEDIEKNVVTATFELPGFSIDEVQINIQNGKLSVSAETKSKEQEETGYTLRERPHGRLSRTLQLPEGVQVCSCLLNIFFE